MGTKRLYFILCSTIKNVKLKKSNLKKSKSSQWSTYFVRCFEHNCLNVLFSQENASFTPHWNKPEVLDFKWSIGFARRKRCRVNETSM